MKKWICSERADFFEPNIYIQFLTEIIGAPDIAALRDAVKAAFAANEATMSRVVLQEDGTAYYEKMNESGCVVSVTNQDYLAVIRENEKQTFQVKCGEMMRVFICTADAKIRLLIMAHHLVGDGKSIAYFLEDVMRALSGEQLEYKEMRLLTADSFPKEAKLPMYVIWYAKRFNRKWKSRGDIFSWDDYEKIHKTYWQKHSSQVIYESFLPEEVEDLRARARKMGVSVNSYIATAFLRANRKNHCIGMAVDARENHNRAMSNQATGISVDYTYSEKLSFAENARAVHRKICQKLEHPVMRYFILQFMMLFAPSLIDSILLNTYQLYENPTTRKLARVMGYQGYKTREIGITNLTRLDIKSVYGNYAIRNLLFIPPVVSYANHIIGVVTTEDGMRISYHYMECDNDAKEQKFFAAGIRYIRDKVSI